MTTVAKAKTKQVSLLSMFSRRQSGAAQAQAQEGQDEFMSNEDKEDKERMPGTSEAPNDSGSTESKVDAGAPVNVEFHDSSHKSQVNARPIGGAPFQPHASEIATQKVKVKSKGGQIKVKTLHFQSQWFADFKWLHYVPSLNGVLCHICATEAGKGSLRLVALKSDSFVCDGFHNWSTAIASFKEHESSRCHKFSRYQELHAKSSQPVEAALSEQTADEQATARKCLATIITTVQYLARQGLALRGKYNDDGNFKQLLKVRSLDAKYLEAWLSRKVDMTSWATQNEILDLFSHSIIRQICADIRSGKQFAIIVDGTQDISGAEQESICLRYVDRQTLEPVEVFVGLYAVSETTGKAMSSMIQDVLLRLNLSLSNLRGQTFDGAANMSGVHNGCQSLISAKQPLALYVHCGAHCVNLVAQHASSVSLCVRDAMAWLQELGNFYGSSLKYRQSFAKIASTDEAVVPAGRIKPLCATRWLMRTPAIESVLSQYRAVLDSLEEAKAERNESRAIILLDRCEKGTTLLGLQIGFNIFGHLEQLNKSLQSTKATVSGMLEAVNIVIRQLNAMRTEESFSAVFLKVSKVIEENHLEPISLPRQRRPPARLSGSAAAHRYATAEEQYRAEYFAFIDEAVHQLLSRFDADKTGLGKYQALQNMLLNGSVSSDICNMYPELDASTLSVELPMFWSQFKYSSVSEALQRMQQMVPDVQQLFPQVKELLVLLAVNPASSATAERSFSSLRRLKTWLRSTMSQQRLNSCAVCNTHRSTLDAVDIKTIRDEFISRNDFRQRLFGRDVCDK